MNRTIFSIVVTVFNEEKYLKQSINSILNQTYKNYEIIIVDDGSTDNSLKIATETKNSNHNVKIVSHENMGVYLSRKEGIKNSNGDFLLFLDGDDYLENNTLDELNKIIEKTKSDLIIFNFNRVDDRGNILEKQDFYFEEGIISDKKEISKIIAKGTQLNNLATKAISKDLYNLHDDYINESGRTLKKGEDLLQSLSFLYSAKNIFYTKSRYYNYRNVASSVTHTFNKESYLDYLYVRKNVLKVFEAKNHDDKELINAFYSQLANTMSIYIIQLFLNERNQEVRKKIINDLNDDYLFNNIFDNRIKNINLIKKLYLILAKRKNFILLNFISVPVRIGRRIVNL